MAQPITQPTARFSLAKLLVLFMIVAVVVGMFKLVWLPVALFSVGAANAAVAAEAYRRCRFALYLLALITSMLWLVTFNMTSFSFPGDNSVADAPMQPAVAACVTQFLAAVAWLLGDSGRSGSEPARRR